LKGLRGKNHCQLTNSLELHQGMHSAPSGWDSDAGLLLLHTLHNLSHKLLNRWRTRRVPLALLGPWHIDLVHCV
jgi:hypothetical protein